MPEIIPDGFGHATFKCAFAGRANLLTFTCGVRLDGDIDTADFASDLFDSFVGEDLAFDPGNTRDSFTFEAVELVYNNGGTMLGQASTQAPVPGTNTTTAVPSINSTLLVQKKTALLGRKFRGRCYPPTWGLSEGAVDPLGMIDSITFAALAERWSQTFLATQDSILSSLVVLHSDATAPTLITSMPLETQIATQRRRMR